MKSRKTKFHPVKLSLRDLIGKEYIEAACKARGFLSPADAADARTQAADKVDFFPKAFQERLIELLPRVGSACVPAYSGSARGATSSEFAAHTQTALAPLSGLGYLRLGEDGRLFLSTKSEHYHVSLGHGFPGYRLIENAKKLGIVNATHNNTRGHITRLLEEQLVRVAAGLPRSDGEGLHAVLDSRKPNALNRVINLETGSLAAEAAVKMVLGRFYRPQAESGTPRHPDRIPVFLVLGDDQGGIQANYHGTTVMTQMMRGMWPDVLRKMEKAGVLQVRSVRPNNIEELESAFDRYENDKTKIAGFFFELVLMNYGARRLSEAFVKRMAALCRTHGVPMVVDEIQTCVWSPKLYLYREYGLEPMCAVLGKGFPGGEYASSRVLFSAELDTLPQFGALVTNGQEELASLAYLITMRWVEDNADVIEEVGGYYEDCLRELQNRHRTKIQTVEGRRHLAGVYFDDVEAGKQFAASLNRAGFDISVQTYKAGCPPSALTKLPLIMGFEAVDLFVQKMDEALKAI